MLSPGRAGMREPRRAEAEQVVAAGRELGPGRDGDGREVRLRDRRARRASSWTGRRCAVPALDSSMNESVALPVVLIRNSLILIGLMFRTFSVVVSVWPRAVRRVEPRRLADQVAVERHRPRGDREGGAHAGTGSDGAKVFERFRCAVTAGPLPARQARLSSTSTARAPEVLVKVSVTSAAPGRERLQARRGVGGRGRRQAEPLHVVPRGDDVGLDRWSVASLG